MIIVNRLKGYLFTGILFLLISCGEPNPQKEVAADPQNCEWYVVPKSSWNSRSNRLDMYALRLYSNGNYVFCADLIFEAGTWQFDEEKQLMILRSKNEDGTEQVRYVVDEQQKNGKTLFQFYHQYPVVETEVDEIVEVRAVSNISNSDPFNTNLHEWRKKPAAPESPQQIKDRTLSYLRFLETFYTHAIENDLENPGGRWYPQPLKFYSNKVSMAYADELADWYNCFYNEEQGIEAYKLLSGALMKVKIAGENDNTRNLNCVKQLIGFVQKM